MERRLAAILAADVVGYSRLMGEDEAGTLAALKRHRKGLIDPKAAQYNGRTIKLMGDGALMEFPSVVEAVTFAVEVQLAMAERNREVPEEQRILYRIGINIGDVIVEDDDIYGDGVNVAARLEALADPGGICVSRTAVDHVKGKVDIEFKDLGPRNVKNIPKPVDVFKVVMETSDRGHNTFISRWASLMRWRIVAGGPIVLAVLIGAALWQRPWDPRKEPISEASMEFSLPDKPSIAVIPFANISNDPNQEYFADGMTEDLITDLSKISGLFVISRNSAFSYKNKAVKVRQIAQELGVRYILEGSVRRSGDNVRINAQLVDAITGGHLWAERYDGTLSDVFDLQDKVTGRIVAALALELTPQEAERVSHPGTDDLEAHDAYLLGLSLYYRRTPDSFAKARKHFEHAINIDPAYPAAHAALAKLYAQADTVTYSRALKINYWDATAKARTSLGLAQDVPNADVHVVRSWLALNKYQHDQAIAEAETALQLKPNDVDALEALAMAKIYGGQPQAGIELAERARRQNPILVTRPLLLRGLAEFALGSLEDAVENFEKAFDLGSEEFIYAAILAATRGLLGNLEKARTALATFQRGHWEVPDLARSMVWFPFSDKKILDRLARGLELAGTKVYFTREDGGYLPLYSANRLSGREIKALLGGATIEGKRFWMPTRWQRTETSDGLVKYTGFPIQAGVGQNEIGVSRVEGDRLCERWDERPAPLELCSVLFRVPKGNAQLRWGPFVLVTDTGPHPFDLAE